MITFDVMTPADIPEALAVWAGQPGIVLREAVTAAKSGTTPITLIIRNGDRFRTVSFDYRGGLRYPRLERIEGTPDRIGDILSARRR